MKIDKDMKDVLICLIIMVAYVLVDRLWLPLDDSGRVPVYWISYFVTVFIIQMLRKEKGKRLLFILPIIIIGNYLLYLLGIYISNNIIVLGSLSAMTIVYMFKNHMRYKKFGITSVLIIFIGFILLNYIDYENRLIKDRYVDKYIKKEYSIKGEITENDLSKVKSFYGYFDGPITLDGFEYMKNLKSIWIEDSIRIKDFSSLNKLGQLEKIIIKNVDLNKIDTFKDMDSVELLEFYNAKKGEVKSLSEFPNLKELRFYEGAVSLKGVKESKTIETLEIISPKSLNIKDIEGSDSLKVLKFKQVYIESVDEILECKSLKIIELENCTLKDKEGFIKELEDRGLSVYKRGNIAQGDYNIMK